MKQHETSLNKYRKLDLVILAGGKGSRIKEKLKNLPKPMVKFRKKNFLQYVINSFSKFPFRKIYILTGYRSNYIFKKYHNKEINFTRIECLKETKLLGTAGSLYNLRKKVNDFVLTNGDSIFEINLNELIKSCSKNSYGSAALTKNTNQESKKLNQLSIKKNKIIFDKNGHLMNGGIYFLKKKIFKYIQNKYMSLENEILVDLIKKNKINGIYSNNFFHDIGTNKFFNKTNNFIDKYLYRPAAFLDRDGVINYEKNYIFNMKNFVLRKGVIKGLKLLQKKNYYLFIVTNQAGIAKKKFSEVTFKKFGFEIKKFFSQKNIFFDDVEYCPFHKDALIKKFRKNSQFRKPGNLMVKSLFKKWPIKKKGSFFIGDQISDFNCAKRSNLYFEYAEKDFFKQIQKIIKN